MEQNISKSNEYTLSSTTFAMDEEYQEANRMEMFHKYKSEIDEHKKYEKKNMNEWNRWYLQLIKNKELRKQRNRDTKKRKRKEVQGFKTSIPPLQFMLKEKDFQKHHGIKGLYFDFSNVK